MKQAREYPKFGDTFGCSQIGDGREANGDQFVVAELQRAARVHHASRSGLDDSRCFGDNQAHVLLVADGVSGRAGAKTASRLVVDEVLDSVLNAVPWTPELDLDSEASLCEKLKETVVRCDDQVSTVARRTSSQRHMASTLTMAFVRWPMAFIVHAGDSRAYLIRDHAIEQLTTDHTVAQQLVEKGGLDPDKAETSTLAQVLWNAVGGDSNVEPELTTRRLQLGDRLLLCSDGLTGHLNEGAIRRLVESSESAEMACEQLVSAVTSIGGHDDVTVAMAHFGDEIGRGARAAEPPVRSSATAAMPIPGPKARSRPGGAPTAQAGA